MNDILLFAILFLVLCNLLFTFFLMLFKGSVDQAAEAATKLRRSKPVIIKPSKKDRWDYVVNSTKDVELKDVYDS